jgi:hypothetical protein
MRELDERARADSAETVTDLFDHIDRRYAQQQARKNQADNEPGD